MARGIFRRFDGVPGPNELFSGRSKAENLLPEVLNAVELALLSGILWQGSPPEEDVEQLGGTFIQLDGWWMLHGEAPFLGDKT